MMQATSVDEQLELLKEGSTLWKVRSLRNWYRRRYILDLERHCIVYEGSNKFVPCSGEQAPNIELEDISDVRRGWKTDRFNRLGTLVEKNKKKRPESLPIMEESCCFSLIYGRASHTLDLVAPSEAICLAWVRGLHHLVTLRKSLRREQNYSQWLKTCFRVADADRTGSLNFEECLSLLKQLNVEMEKRHARMLFEEANTNKKRKNGEDVLDEDEFVGFYHALLKRPELEELFKRHCVTGSDIMGPNELYKFLVEEQKMDTVDLDYCEDVIDAFEPAGDMKLEGYMTLDGFRKMLLSDDQDIFNSNHLQVYQDMTQPLTHYYIASSHNTYLLSDQLMGESSLEGYIQALKKGCRCVELDCWDGPDGEPIIYHGYTLTSKIFLKDVLVDAIKPYAFKASQYPLILSLENHCSTEQQKRIAQHLQDILGDMLYIEPVTDELVEMPSPEELKMKILLKAKKLPPGEQRSSKVDSASGDSLKRTGNWVQNQNNGRPTPQVMITSATPDHGQPSDQGRQSPVQVHSNGELEAAIDPFQMELSEDDEEDVDFIDATHPPKKRSTHEAKLAQELSDLVVFCRAVRFQNFAQSRLKDSFCYMSSLSEKKATALIEEDTPAFIQHTQRQLVRIYPKGARTSSSNYNPTPMWNVGCQIVALNYQTSDKAMFFNWARFKENGGCGYVLKTEFMRNDASDIANLLARKPRKVLVKVISGQHIPKPGQSTEGEIVDPYVMVKIRGHPLDKHKERTRYIRNNGFNPVWNEEITLSVRIPEVAMLYFKVKDNNSTGRNERLGEYMLPLHNVQQGYRNVPLVERSGKTIVPATLFVHVTIQ